MDTEADLARRSPLTILMVIIRPACRTCLVVHSQGIKLAKVLDLATMRILFAGMVTRPKDQQDRVQHLGNPVLDLVLPRTRNPRCRPKMHVMGNRVMAGIPATRSTVVDPVINPVGKATKAKAMVVMVLVATVVATTAVTTVEGGGPAMAIDFAIVRAFS